MVYTMYPNIQISETTHTSFSLLLQASIPYSYSVMECKMDDLLKLRRDILEG